MHLSFPTPTIGMKWACMYVCVVTQIARVWINRVTYKVANPARGQLNREIDISLSPFAPENLVSRDGFSRPVPRQPAHYPYSG